MKTIIAGSRSITSYATVCDAIAASGWADQITEVVCGMAIGVDLLGKRWGDENGIHVEPFKVTDEDYRILGRYRGPKARNELMANYGEALLLVWDGVSGGSMDMLERARNHKLRIWGINLATGEVFTA